jgi:TolA-binding protein
MKTLNYLSLIVLLTSTGCLTTRSQLKEQNKLQTEVASLQENKAEVTAKQVDIENQMRDFNGRIEVLELNVKELREALQNQESQKKLDKELVDNKFKTVQEALIKTESEFQKLYTELDKLKKSSLGSTGAKKSSASNQGNYSQAEVDFANKRWKEAAVGYQKYRDANPKGTNYADATYKIGVCFQEMGMKTEAKAFFDEAVERFPNSRTAEKAKYRLKTLK